MNEAAFSVSKRYWLNWFTTLILGSLFILYVGSFLLDDFGESLLSAIFAGGFLLFLIVIFGHSLKTNSPFPWKIKLILNEVAIQGFDGNNQLCYSWDELIFIHFEPKPTPHLYFFANKSNKVFNLGNLPAMEVWRSIQKYANPITLQEGSYELVIARDIAYNEAKLADIKLPLVIEINSVFRGLLGFGILFFASIAAFCWWQTLWVGFLFFLSITIWSIYTIIQLGPVELNADIIRYRPWKREFEILWEEIIAIELDQGGNAIVFHGPNKQLSVPGLMLVKKQTKEYAIMLLDSQIRSRQIQSTTSWKAMFRQQKNTRIRP